MTLFSRRVAAQVVQLEVCADRHAAAQHPIDVRRLLQAIGSNRQASCGTERPAGACVAAGECAEARRQILSRTRIATDRRPQRSGIDRRGADGGDYEIETLSHDGEQFQRVLIPGTSQTAVPGAPQVPTRGALLGLPTTGGASLRVLEADCETLSRRTGCIRRLNRSPKVTGLRIGEPAVWWSASPWMGTYTTRTPSGPQRLPSSPPRDICAIRRLRRSSSTRCSTTRCATRSGSAAG